MDTATITGPAISVPRHPNDQTPTDKSTARPTPLPPTTTSSSLEYQHRLSEIVSRATFSDPLYLLFQRELSGHPTAIHPTHIYATTRARLATKTAAGATVVEAGSFAAVACWEPPASIPPDLPDDQLRAMARTRPVFASFVRDMQRVRHAVFGDSRAFWMLSMMARDPERQDKGAVRAVIEPFVARARREGVGLWLVAGNERARDVYGYFGFRVVEVMLSFPTEEMRREGGLSEAQERGVPSWCMVCNWPVEEV